MLPEILNALSELTEVGQAVNSASSCFSRLFDLVPDDSNNYISFPKVLLPFFNILPKSLQTAVVYKILKYLSYFRG